MTFYSGEHQYLHILETLMLKGEHGLDLRNDRTGVGTFGDFGAQMTFSLKDGQLPLLTTKKLHTKSIIHELLWMISGSTNVKYLQDNGVTIWDEWADENGELGPVYGKQWRRWEEPWDVRVGDYGLSAEIEYGYIDQLANVIKGLKEDPYGRRHIVSAWNVADIPKMALPPCHMLFQFHVDPELGLSCQLYQRSADWFLGVPFNIAFYSLLTHMVAQQIGVPARKFVHTVGDYHLYSNHLKQARKQLDRDVRVFPQVEIVKRDSIDDYTYDDFKIIGYDPHPGIKAPVAV